MTHRSPTLGLALGSLLLLAGCGSKPAPESPTPAPGATSTYSPAPSAPGVATTPAANDAGNAAAAEEARRREAANRARAVLQQQVYFEFDRADLTPQARELLKAKLEVLRNFSAVTLTVAGHADERGSDEYNLALGNRRANAVRQYLIQQGVLSGRMQTVSFGEEQPAVVGHDESAWSRNRRAEFQIRAGLN